MLESFIEIAQPVLIALDVLIVAYVLYRVYVLLSRTRAVPLLFGFGIILLVERGARWLELETVSWLITNVSSYLVFGLIVLLQPELRRLVAGLGHMPLFRWFQPQAEIPIDDILDAVRDMAATKVGSIIVILRELRHQNIIDHAVRMDALVTSELLQTIFHKDTPLHDGALLIESNRIAAAACYLPLSQSRTLKRSHGARHRAALGLSEESDAVIILTSEETGKITVFFGGEMRTALKSMELKYLVMRLLEGGASSAMTAERPERRRKSRDKTSEPKGKTAESKDKTSESKKNEGQA